MNTKLIAKRNKMLIESPKVVSKWQKRILLTAVSILQSPDLTVNHLLSAYSCYRMIDRLEALKVERLF